MVIPFMILSLLGAQATLPAPAPEAAGLLQRQVRIWGDAERRETALATAHALNPEWDFMSRTFLVLALAEQAHLEPSFRPTALRTMDAVIADTLERERQLGLYHFLMEYARYKPWVLQPPRSFFIDGEIVLMVAVRRLLEESPRYRAMQLRRVTELLRRMAKSPVLSGESYPDECWLFCNAIVLAALRLTDLLDGTDHRAVTRAWLKVARLRLADPKTGLLISAWTQAGEPVACGRGPEGSSIWLAAHMLRLVDPAFARSQYDLARKALGRVLMGLGYSLEWPSDDHAGLDVDAGEITPLLQASTSASGLALVAARSFGDSGYHQALLRSLRLAVERVSSDEELSVPAAGQVGEAVILYGMLVGPWWDELVQRLNER